MQLARKIRQLIYFVGSRAYPLSLSTPLSLTSSYWCIDANMGHTIFLSLSLSLFLLSLDIVLFALLWRVAIGEVAVKSFMNFKQAPLWIEPRSFLIFLPARRRCKKDERVQAQDSERKRGRERGKKRERECVQRYRQHREPLVRLYDE